MASCLKAIWSQRFQSVIFGAAQLLYFSALIAELTNRKEVEAWTYNYSIKGYSWNYSRAFCQKYYTDLVAIQNKNEIAHLNDVIPYYKSYYWIGIRKINDKWMWVGTKKPLTIEAENWADNEPNNKKNNEDCVEIYIKSPTAPGKWNDDPCWKRKRALCYTASCQDTSCNNQGECIETIGNYTCSCYPGFYGPECEHVRECGTLHVPEHALMNCSHPLQTFSLHSQCSFRCPEGYQLSGPSTLQCLASGMWDNKLPQCVVVQCQPLERPNKATMDCAHPLADFAYGSSCKFECQTGYRVRGSDTLYCTGSGQWTAPLPTCEATTCKPLESPAHGIMDCAPSERAFLYNTKCSFHCAEGFVLKGADAVQCTDSGEWTAPAPVCQALQCQDLPRPKKAQMDCSNPFGAFRYRSVCSFSCDEGSLLVGASVLECLDTGHWSAAPPECQAITCTPLLSPQNGTLTCIQPRGDASYKSTCQFSCDEGFSLSGPERLDCTPSGQWTGSAPTCKVRECGTLHVPEHALMNCSHPLQTFSLHSQCSFRCPEGYQLSGPSTLQCLASGMWDNKLPQCVVVQCQPLESPNKATMVCAHPLADFAYGSSCKFECQTGYRVRGSDTLYCTGSGQWTAPLPTCEATTCKPLESPAHGIMDCAPSERAFLYNTKCSFHCAEGFVLKGADAVQCTDSGEWTAPAPVCQAIKCPELFVPEQGSMDCSGTHGEFSVGSTCHFSCSKGFKLEGSNNMECKVPGRWSAPPPSCKAMVSVVTPQVQCPALTIPSQGTMSCRHHLATFGFNTTCYFGCKAGFTLLGDSILSCSPSGRWTAVTPTCRAVTCPALHIDNPGEMNCSTPWGRFSFGSTCTFHCPKGQLLNGSARAECQENGQWSAPTPTCQAGSLTIREALTYVGGGVASLAGLATVGTLLALLRKRFRQKDEGKSPLSPHSHLGTYGVFTNAAFDQSS
ncbi:P-selectin isoform X1 [Ochotona curzoniae]|uniref:P-selectin isoform X1 n=1 Tax=Ochotona curzoniae TaxID=130825 RepID=UPI001B3499FA|nr:P-selectin isoform X1 [Ochotona curzoniae]